MMTKSDVAHMCTVDVSLKFLSINQLCYIAHRCNIYNPVIKAVAPCK